MGALPVETESFFRTVFEMIPQMVWTKDAQGRNEYCNQQLLDYLAITLDDFLYRPWENAHPDDAEGTLALWRTASAGGLPFSAVVRLPARCSFSRRMG